MNVIVQNWLKKICLLFQWFISVILCWKLNITGITNLHIFTNIRENSFTTLGKSGNCRIWIKNIQWTVKTLKKKLCKKTNWIPMTFEFQWIDLSWLKKIFWMKITWYLWYFFRSLLSDKMVDEYLLYDTPKEKKIATNRK